MVDFNTVKLFEEKVADFFGAPYAVATDSCTHAIELALRYLNIKEINCPKRTYLSIPFLASKLNIKLYWRDENWQNYYFLTDLVVDAAVLWRKDSYISGKFMGISFQKQKHLNLLRGGCLLVPDGLSYNTLKAMSYDGRPDLTKPWRTQNIKMYGYHYYMLPETAALGLEKLDTAIETPPKIWHVSEWPDLSIMDVFNPKLKYKFPKEE